MTERLNGSGEIFMPIDLVEVQMAAQLSFARGKVGQRYPLHTDDDKAAFALECAEHTRALTLTKTADCGDERLTIALGDGTTDPYALEGRIAPQLFGGLFLATTKATVEADAAIVKDSQTFWEAFLAVKDVLNGLGYKDAAHQNCGAEKMVESSIENQLDHESTLGTINLLFGPHESNELLLSENTDIKRRRLAAGFYSDWNTEKRKELVLADAPSNYSYLKEDSSDVETNGHNGSGLYVVTKTGVGYQKMAEHFPLLSR